MSYLVGCLVEHIIYHPMGDCQRHVIKKIVGHAGKGITEQVYTQLEMEQLLDTINKI